MKTLWKATVLALVIELVCMGLLYLGERDFLGEFHLDFLALIAMLLHLGGILITSGRWADEIHPAVFTTILFFVQWLVWIGILYVFLLVQGRWRRKQTPVWKKLCAVAGVLVVLVLLVSRWDWPQPVSHAPGPPPAPKGIVVRSVRENGLVADFFYGPFTRPRKAVILLGGSEGGKSWSASTDFIQELVGQDFCVLSLAYFGTETLPSQLRTIPLEYFATAFDWLATQKELVIPNDYALVGASRGGELALLLGSRYPEIKAVVAIAPSSFVVVGFPTSKLDALRGQHSSWTVGGQELAFLPMLYSWATLRGILTGSQTRMCEQALRNSRHVKAATIRVENIRGPILLVSFTQDEVWPSTLMSELLMRRLHDKQFRFRYEHAAYDTGHCNWNIEPCRRKIMDFLRDWSSTPTSAPGPTP